MKILVLGSTSMAGRHVIKRLLKQGYYVRALTTSVERAKKLPNGAEVFIGNLEKIDSVESAFKDIDVVYMINAYCETEMLQGVNALLCALKYSVKKFIYQSIYNLRQGRHNEHFLPKIYIEDALMASGINYIILNTSHFFQNDFLFKNSLTDHKIYTQPLGEIGLNRVDLRDVADVVAQLVATDKFDRKRIPLLGSQNATGMYTTGLLSEKLGIMVSYAGNIKAFKQSIPIWLPEDALERWSSLYDFYLGKGLVGISGDMSVITDILGREPQTYQAFLNDYRRFFI